MAINTVGVLGAGVMGSGVAQNLAQKAFNVILIDISESVLEKTRSTIYQNIRMAGFFNREEKVDDPDVVIGRINFTVDYSVLSAADFVIENIVENWGVKKEVYAKIDDICPKHCIFASNTSAISITRIASATHRPPQVLGIHFMNPVPQKETVEVIRGFHTTDGTIDTAQDLLNRMGKKGIVVNDYPGFVSNRVLMLTVNEAVFLVQDRVASAEDVDEIFKSCFGHKMGPLETADLIGLDTILYSLDVLYESYNDPKFRPSPLLKKMVDAGLYGRKSGEGFYQYPDPF